MSVSMLVRGRNKLSVTLNLKVRHHNPKLVDTSLSGFGAQGGPGSGKAAPLFGVIGTVAALLQADVLELTASTRSPGVAQGPCIAVCTSSTSARTEHDTSTTPGTCRAADTDASAWLR